MNKTLIIVLLLVIIGGGVYLYSANRATAPKQAAEIAAESQEAATESAVADPSSEDAMDHGEMGGGDSVGGNDVGMEFPDIEAGADGALDADASAKVFNLDSFNFGYSADEIRVNRGDTVVINLTSSGGFHDWVVDEFEVATDRIREGEATSVTFVADEAGAFEYYCSVGNHRAQGMVGTLVVE